MPSDPFGKVTRGDPLSVQAQSWNAFVDSAVAFTKIKHQMHSGPVRSSRSTTIVRVQNQSGNDLLRGEVLGLNGPIFDPAVTEDYDALLREISFKGDIPDITKHKRNYVILLEATPALFYEDQPVVLACMSGLCYVKVDIKHAHHEYAIIVDQDTTHLKSSRFGHARILWKEGDSADWSGPATGIQWCIVEAGYTGTCFAVGKASGDIPARTGSSYGKGTVALYRSSTGLATGTPVEDGPLETIDVLNAAGDSAGKILSGKYCGVAWDGDDVAWASPLEC